LKAYPFDEPIKMVDFVSYVTQNYDVKKSKIYNDKNNGLLRVNEGLVSPDDALVYLKTLSIKDSVDTGPIVQKKLLRQIKKLDAEIRRLEHANKINERQYIERTRVENYVKSRFMLMHTQVNSILSSTVREIRNALSESEAQDLATLKVESVFRNIAIEKHFELVLED